MVDTYVEFVSVPDNYRSMKEIFSISSYSY